MDSTDGGKMVPFRRVTAQKNPWQGRSRGNKEKQETKPKTYHE